MTPRTFENSTINAKNSFEVVWVTSKMGGRYTFGILGLLCSLDEFYAMTGILDISQSVYFVKVEVLSFFVLPKFLRSVEKSSRAVTLDKFFFFQFFWGQPWESSHRLVGRLMCCKSWASTHPMSKLNPNFLRDEKSFWKFLETEISTRSENSESGRSLSNSYKQKS